MNVFFNISFPLAIALLWLCQSLACHQRVRAFRLQLEAQNEAIDLSPSQPQRRAMLVIPVKGISDTLEQFGTTVLNQNYPEYRVLFTLESEADPAAPVLRQLIQEHPLGPSAELVFAGMATNCGQKVFNQLAAMELVEAGDKLIVFADADIRLTKNWLTELVEPLNAGAQDLVSGYRTLIPRLPSLANIFGSIINSSVSTLSGKKSGSLLWGGSMAITRETYDELNVPKLFAHSLNDDLLLSSAAKRTGKRIEFQKSLLIPTDFDAGWTQLWEFGRRQYFQIKIYSPKHYALVLFATGLYFGGLSSALTLGLTGHITGWAILVGVMAVDASRAHHRIALYRQWFEEADFAALRATFFWERFGTPIWMTLHGLIALSAMPLRGIAWSGIYYRMNDTEVAEIVRKDKLDRG
ncbi:MAG: glycosyltransferase [Fuerstiella sp.]|nr:glycosyltransferase [Fuerstiella sp.]